MLSDLNHTLDAHNKELAKPAMPAEQTVEAVEVVKKASDLEKNDSAETYWSSTTRCAFRI